MLSQVLAHHKYYAVPASVAVSEVTGEQLRPHRENRTKIEVIMVRMVTCNPSAWGPEAGTSTTCIKYKASLDYTRPCFETKATIKTTEASNCKFIPRSQETRCRDWGAVSGKAEGPD